MKLSSKNTLSKDELAEIKASNLANNPGKTTNKEGTILGFPAKQAGKDLMMIVYTKKDFKGVAFPVYDNFSVLPSPFGNNIESIIFVMKNKSGENYHFYRAREMKVSANTGAGRREQLTNDIEIIATEDFQGLKDLYFSIKNNWSNSINSMKVDSN